MKLSRDPFAIAAVGLACVAFAGSFDHTLATVQDHGQAGWVAVATALMPEVSVALSVLRIRKGGRRAQVQWAWLVLVSSALFTVWANLEQAQPTVGGMIVGGWPAWAAIGAAGFIEMSQDKARPVRARQTPAQPAAAPSQDKAPVSSPQRLTSVPAAAEGASVDGWSLARDYAREHNEPPPRAWLMERGVTGRTATRIRSKMLAEVAA